MNNRPPASGRPTDILIVEDSPTQAAQLENILREHGFAVHVARDGRAGLAAVRTFRPDLVISDVVMPELTGFEMCKLIKADDEIKHTPVILLTSLADPMDIIAGLECGADNFLTKPYQPPHLLSRVSNLLSNRRLRRHDGAGRDLQLSFMEQRFTITSDRSQMLDLLISTFEQAMQLNEERVARQEELERVNQQLAAASAHKSRFLANMSHELRTPLNSILGFAELLQDPDFGTLDDQQRGFVTHIHTAGAHLLKLINDILDLSKVAAGKIELHLEQIALNELLQHIGETLRPVAALKQLTLTVHPLAEPVQVLADASRLKQILYNLISNAIKFTPPGGHVTVRAAAGTDVVQLSVEDDGIGIALQEQERIFEEFQQIDSALSRQYEGTGLGLALTRRFVRLLGGTLSVSSAPGQGSTFEFTLPRQSAGAARTHPDGTDAEGLPPTVLVIEDDSRSLELASAYLVHGGYRVLLAGDGEEGLRKAQELRPFAIVIDVTLPVNSGWKVLAELKSGPATQSIPVVIVSDVDDHIRGFNLGASVCLIKPVQRAELMTSVNHLAMLRNVLPRDAGSQPIDASRQHPEVLDLTTGLFNGRYFNKRLHEEVARGQRYQRAFSVAVIVLDDFDEFTGSHGPEQAHHVLRQFSRLLEKTFRTADPIAKLHGDGFGVLLPETVGASAAMAAEKLRVRVQAEPFPLPHGGDPARLTVSIGLAEYPSDGATPEELTRSARTALASTGVGTHNKVITASPPTDEGNSTP